MKTAIVILNYNTKDYLEKFLPGILSSIEGMDAGVIVADNASTDGSPRLMNERFPDVPLILLDKNYGFTGGYNRALEKVQAEYFLLLNSDVEVPEGWLSPLVEWMDSHPECGACGPKLLSWYDRESFEYAGAAGGLIDRYGYPYCRGRILRKTEKDEGQYDNPVQVLWASGACLMVRSSAWKAMGGLDKRFFAHMEEIDLCWRMQLEGWSVWNVPASKVYHVGGGTLPKTSPFKLRLNFRNNLLMLQKNLPASLGSTSKARRRIFIRMTLDGVSAILYLLTFRWSCFKAVIQAHKEYRALRDRWAVVDAPAPSLHGLSSGCILLGSRQKLGL